MRSLQYFLCGLASCDDLSPQLKIFDLPRIALLRGVGVASLIAVQFPEFWGDFFGLTRAARLAPSLISLT